MYSSLDWVRCKFWGADVFLQSKKQAEEDAARELNELFAQAIKQPKVPLGEHIVSQTNRALIVHVVVGRHRVAPGCLLLVPSWCMVAIQSLFAIFVWQEFTNNFVRFAGVDPKSVLCEFHKHGRCTKGFKCKFSHDLNVERKGAKIDLYTER